MFGLIKKTFTSTMAFFSFNVFNVNSLECDSTNNQECKIRPEKIIINTNEPVFYPYSIKIVIQLMIHMLKYVFLTHNVKVFNLMLRTNETRHIKWHKTCKCECKLDASACNNKQRWNEDKCRCECTELIDKGVCDKEFI